MALACCHIEARENEIIVVGTDLELTLRIVVPATVLEEGKAIIHAHQLLEAVMSQPSGTQILLNVSAMMTFIDVGNYKARLTNMDINEYPQVPKMDTNPCIKMNALDFKSLIMKTMFSVSKDDTRAEFTGVSMKVSQNGQIKMASTDGHRLSCVKTTANICAALHPQFEEFGVIFPKKSLIEFNKFLTDNTDIEFGIDSSGKKIVVSFSNMTYYVTPIGSGKVQFPDYSKIIPSNIDHKAIVKRDEFMQMLRRAAVFSNKMIGTVHLEMSNGKLEIHAIDSVRGEMHDYIDAEYQGSGVKAGFNWQYIIDVLSVIDSDYVSFEVTDMDSPVLIHDVTTDTCDFLVMPMQY